MEESQVIAWVPFSLSLSGGVRCRSLLVSSSGRLGVAGFVNPACDRR